MREYGRHHQDISWETPSAPVAVALPYGSSPLSAGDPAADPTADGTTPPQLTVFCGFQHSRKLGLFMILYPQVGPWPTVGRKPLNPAAPRRVWCTLQLP